MFGIKATFLILTCAAIATVMAGAGCAGSPSGSAATGGRGAPAEIVVIGDWNDVEAAAIAGVDQNETVIVAQHATEREQVFELLTILDERGKLVATREGKGADLIPIHLTCEVGLFGDAGREGAIVRDAGRRLRDLAGVDYRPRR